MNYQTAQQISEQLFNYMTYRAAKENLGHSVTADFYLDSILSGKRRFFGIGLNEDGIVDDDDNPATLAEWRAQHAY